MPLTARHAASQGSIKSVLGLADEGSSVEGAFVAADRRLTGWRP
jgi:hypothetical protein